MIQQAKKGDAAQYEYDAPSFGAENHILRIYEERSTLLGTQHEVFNIYDVTPSTRRVYYK